MKTLSCTCGGFLQDGAFVHSETCGRTPVRRPTPKMLREALSGDWDYSQAVLVVRNMRNHVGNAWEWLTPQVREALVAQQALSVILTNSREAVPTLQMKKLLSAMRVAAGLATLEEVT